MNVYTHIYLFTQGIEGSMSLEQKMLISTVGYNLVAGKLKEKLQQMPGEGNAKQGHANTSPDHSDRLQQFPPRTFSLLVFMFSSSLQAFSPTKLLIHLLNLSKN